MKKSPCVAFLFDTLLVESNHLGSFILEIKRSLIRVNPSGASLISPQVIYYLGFKPEIPSRKSSDLI